MIKWHSPPHGVIKRKIKMYAIVEIAGQQFKVEKGKKIFVHRLDNEEGKNVSFDNVLLIDNDGKVLIGEPHIKGAFIEGKILEHTKGKKVVVFKKKRRKGYKVKKGHRQQFSYIEIVSINEKGKKPEAAKASPEEKPKAEARKPAAKTTSAKEAPVKKTTAKKPAAKKTAAKETPAKETAVKKPAATKKTTAAKPAATKKASTAKKTASTKKPAENAKKEGTETSKTTAAKKTTTAKKKTTGSASTGKTGAAKPKTGSKAADADKKKDE